jgi:hypothetical protein
MQDPHAQESLEQAATAGTPPAAPQNEKLPDEDLDSMYHRRFANIQAYCLDGQQRSDKLMAGLNGANSDLLEAELHVAIALRRTLTKGPNSLANIQASAPAMNLMLRLTKQIEQIARLETSSLKRERPQQATKK